MVEKFRYCACVSERRSESGSLILIYNRDTLQMRNFQRRTMLYRQAIHYAQMFTLWLIIRLYTLKFDLFFSLFPSYPDKTRPSLDYRNFGSLLFLEH